MEMTKKGHCLNFGNCPKADRKEIIELSFTEDFVCPECQQDLIEITLKQNPLKKLLIPGIALLVIGGLIWGVFTFVNLQKNKVKNVVEIGKTVVEKSKGGGVMLSENINKLVKEADSFFENKDFENAKNAYNAILALDPNNIHAKQGLIEIGKINLPPIKDGKDEELDKGERQQPKTPVKITKKLNLDFGDYEGETLNGLPQGLGIMYFNQRHIINPKDPEERYAEAGEFVSGVFHDGFLVNGKYFGKDKQQKGTLLIGQ